MNWINKLESKVKNKLAPSIYDFVAGGADDEYSVTSNRAILDSYGIRPRVLCDVSSIDTHVQLSGQKLSSPIIVAPMAPHGLLHDEGEVVTAKAAAKSQHLMIVSCMSGKSMKSIMHESQAKLWYQTHIFSDKVLTRRIIEHAITLGYQSIVLTVDMPIIGSRLRNLRNRFRIPDELLSPDLLEVGLLKKTCKMTCNRKSMNNIFDASASWKEIEWLRSFTKIPIYLKGILNPEDVTIASQLGVNGVIISNHGGRQLGAAQAPLQILLDIIAENKLDIELLVDGCLQSGADVFKAIAMGANGVLIGRPIMWGLANGGEYGVSGVLNKLQHELELTMKLSGVPTIAALQKEKQGIISKYS